MSEDTPECAKLQHLKNKYFYGNMSLNPLPLAMYSKTRRSQILSKMIPSCLNMDLRPCPRVIYALYLIIYLCRQCDYHFFFLLTMY